MFKEAYLLTGWEVAESLRGEARPPVVLADYAIYIESIIMTIKITRGRQDDEAFERCRSDYHL